MSSLDELKDRLRRPLERELLMGCEDRVVSGGLEKLIANLAVPFPEVQKALSHYSQHDIEVRKDKLQQALRLLGSEVKAVSDTPKRPAPIVSGGSKTLSAAAGIESLSLGTASTKKLHALGLRTLRDLLHNYPRRHEDRRVLPHFQEVQDGERITVSGKLVSKERRAPKPGMVMVEATLENSRGVRLKCVWFQQPWVDKGLSVGQKLIVSGRAKRYGRSLQVQVEYFEEEGEDSLDIGRIVSVYDSKEGISQTFLRSATQKALGAVSAEEYLDGSMRARYQLTDLPEAIWNIHFPTQESELERALHRLRFDEYLFLELRMLLQGEESVLLGKQFKAVPEDIDTFEGSLPFSFTGAQKRVLYEISADMQSERQMARLVQGDVGSGKTAVAACALYLATRDGYQGALMAPTEILARQHAGNLEHYLKPLGLRVELLYGSMSAKQKRSILEATQSGEIDILVGTQALIQEGVEFRDLGLAVIDEEHRFGVMQRRALLKNRPDVLVMSATPIPRSLALTAYGDLELSVIDELPPGRTPIKTKLVYGNHRQQAYGFVMTQIRQGQQAYVVASLIEESETLEDLRAATQLFEDLKVLLPEARIELLHGRMKAAEKDDIMGRFGRHGFDLLVSTTVIEVGVDVPNATVMIIENAERFGLAQLHQLRGRVGRGKTQSYCVLVAGDASQKTKKRLKVIESSTDGFVIAEADLRLRGPGEIRGTRQSGLPDLKLGDLVTDTEIIEHARTLAQSILRKDPTLSFPEHAALKHELQARSNQVAIRDVI